jgi:hypothetical protein
MDSLDILDLDKTPMSDIEDEKEIEKETVKNLDSSNSAIYSIFNNTDKTIYIRIISQISYRSPFIKELLEFNIEKSYIKFNGYYHVENANETLYNHGFNVLPQIVIIVYRGLDRGLDSVLDNPRKYYLSEIYHKEVIENTSEYTYDEEEGYNICFFPTGIIILKFKILETYDNLNIAKKRLNDMKL